MNNIDLVLKKNVCSGCGICQNICPKQCIKTVLDRNKGYYVTTLDSAKCIDCGLCKKVCPVYTWSNQENHWGVGNYRGIYSGFSTNPELRKECASGGITTSLLIYLLEQNQIDAAVVTSRKEQMPLESELRLVSTKEELLKCKGSVYAPTSYNEIIPQIISAPYKRIAIVGLPCHIQAVSMLAKNKKYIEEKIFLKIALVCGHTPSLKGYEYSLRHLGITPANLASIENRGDGWPGYLKIKERHKVVNKLPYGSKYSWGMVLSSPLFTPPGCAHCADPTGYLADISVCDAWLDKFKEDRNGRNLILVRTEKSKAILLQMQQKGYIVLANESLTDFIKANQAVFRQKLIINGKKNKKIRKEELYASMNYLPSTSFLSYFFIKTLLIAERMYVKSLKGKYINDSVLFVFKALKFLSEKWLNIKIS